MVSAKVVWNGGKLRRVVIVRLADARSPPSHGPLNPDCPIHMHRRMRIQLEFDPNGIQIIGS